MISCLRELRLPLLFGLLSPLKFPEDNGVMPPTISKVVLMLLSLGRDFWDPPILCEVSFLLTH